MSAPQTFSGNSNWKDYILSSAAPTWLIISHTYGNTKMICGRAPNPPQPLTSRNTWPTSPANSTSVHHTRLFLSYEPMQVSCFSPASISASQQMSRRSRAKSGTRKFRRKPFSIPSKHLTRHCRWGMSPTLLRRWTKPRRRSS